MTDEGKSSLCAGKALLREAQRDTVNDGPSPSVELKLRRSHAILRSAMDHLEDTPLFEEAHELLDEAGALARNIYPDGCHLDYRDHAYHLRCPVALAHNRVAFSPELLIREAECSICHVDPRTCEHVPGETYDGETCHRLITQVDILDIMLVGRPATPDARINEVSVPTSDLARTLGEEFRPGIRVLCDRCLTTCHGVVRNFD